VQVYLDNNASTKPLDEVVEAMIPFLDSEYANPSSVHRFGQRVRHRVECARQQVARLINAEPREIVFTSGGTESVNLAIRGALAVEPKRRHVITSAVEHNAVHRLATQLAGEGYRVDRIGVDHQGRLDYDQLADRVSQDTTLISIMHANNETGVLFDVGRICEIAARHDVRVHVDAVQSVGKLPVDVKELPVHLLSMSAHKMHGPKGVGALFARRRTRLAPGTFGGRQERDLRPGTENVPGIIGFGVAAQEAAKFLQSGMEPIRRLRDDFERRVCKAVSIAKVIGAETERLDGTSNISFKQMQADAMLILLSERGVQASAGAACSSGAVEPSRVLAAMGVDPHVARGAVRFSLSRFTTASDIDRAVKVIGEVVERLSVLMLRC